MYDKGKESPKIISMVEWYTKSAERNSSAQYNLGVEYASGKGLSQLQGRVKWYRKSAEQGHAMAQYNLGFMYNKGKVPQDYGSGEVV